MEPPYEILEPPKNPEKPLFFAEEPLFFAEEPPKLFFQAPFLLKTHFFKNFSLKSVVITFFLLSLHPQRLTNNRKKHTIFFYNLFTNN